MSVVSGRTLVAGSHTIDDSSHKTKKNNFMLIVRNQSLKEEYTTAAWQFNEQQ